jgi:hypothetical protein
VTDTVGEVFRVVDLLGVFGNAVLGGIVARELRMDPVGFVALAILSGLGGGLIRDTLLQHGPPVALTDYFYILTAVAGAIIAFLVPVDGRIWNRVFPVIDAFALGCWAAAGAGLAARHPVGHHHRGRWRRDARPDRPPNTADLRWQHALRHVRVHRQHRGRALRLRRAAFGRRGGGYVRGGGAVPAGPLARVAVVAGRGVGLLAATGSEQAAPEIHDADTPANGGPLSRFQPLSS